MPSKILTQINRRPLIAASIGGNRNLIASAKKAARLGADLIELRIDSLNLADESGIANLIKQIKKSSGLPAIATVRSAKEQGPGSKSKLTESQREEIFKRVIPSADLIDIELSADAINRDLIRQAHRSGKKTILSYHDFRSVPSQSKIRQLAQKFKSLSGNILKIAATPKSYSELGAFMSACLALKGTTRIFVAMGRIGRISRLVGFSFGSCLTYGSVEKSFAPGQISIKELADFRGYFYGKTEQAR